MAWWSPSWLYKCPITLTNNSGNALSDFQVLIELTPSNFHYEHCKEDGGDIRFVNATEDTELPYWIEEWNYNGTSKIWVKADSIPEGSNVCLYLYYGNPSASSESNRTAVFDFFDDFGDNDISDWSTNMWGSSNNGDIITDNYQMRLRVYRCYNVEAYHDIGTYTATTLSFRFDWKTKADNWMESVGWRVLEDGEEVSKTVIDGSNPSVGRGTTRTGSVEAIADITNGVVTLLFQIHQSGACSNSDHGNTYFWVDNILVRKYADPEPTFELGSEVRAETPSYTFNITPLFEADLKHNNTYITGATLENTIQAEACIGASHQEELNVSPLITDTSFGIGGELLLASEVLTSFSIHSSFLVIDISPSIESMLGVHFIEELSQTSELIASPLLTAIIGGVAAGNLLSYRVTQEWGTYDTAEVRFKGIPNFRAGDYVQIVQEDYYTKNSVNIFKGVVVSMDKTHKKNFEETIAKAASFEWYLTKQYCFWDEYTEHASLSSDINAKRYIKYWLGGGSLEVGTEGVHWDLITGVRPFIIEEVPNWAEKYCRHSDCSFNFFIPGGTTKWDAIMQICDACDFVFYCTYSGPFAKRHAYFRPRERIEEGYYPFGEQLTIDATDESLGFNKRLLEIRSRESQSTPDTKVNRVALTCRDFPIVYKEHPFVGKAGGYKPVEVHRGIDWANIDSVDQLQEVCDNLYEWLRKPNTVYEAKLLSLVELADGTPLHTGFKIKVENVEGHPEDVYRITKITHEKKGEDPIAITTLEYRDVDLIHFGSPKLNEIEIIADVIESRVEKGPRIPGHPCPKDPRSVVIGDFARVEHGTIVAINESENTVDIQINRTGQIVRGVPIT